MPRWGLTEEMRAAKPWGLNPDHLRTAKVITDPVHGDIFITDLERRVIDSPPFERLRRVYQLGTTHLVYPGATHTRFAHSLGSLRVTQDLVDAVLDQQLGPHPERSDLFAEWREELRAEHGSVEWRADERWLGEMTVLARLGGLLHDFCHVPYGHTLEDDLGLLPAHDKNLARLDRLWRDIDTETQELLQSERLDAYLKPMILPKYRPADFGREAGYPELVEGFGGERARAERYQSVMDIVGNTICADLLDYLRRDHLFTGLPFAGGSRYLASFYVTPKRNEPYYPQRMVLRITRGDRERVDVVTELLKHLRYRYELSERALVHHAKLAADAMVGKAIEMWQDDRWHDAAAEHLDVPSDSLPDEISSLKEGVTRNEARKITRRVQGQLEDLLLRRGDLSFLETLAEWPTPGSERGRSRAVRELASDVLNRRLYKQIGEQGDPGPGPNRLYQRFGAANDRRLLEQGAARFAGIEGAWKILLWIPEPKMRLKVAEVLVDDAGSVRTFVDRERGRGGRGAEIYEDHRRLWTLRVFAHPSLCNEAGASQLEAVLSFLGAELDVRFGDLASRYGAEPTAWRERLAVANVLREEEFQNLTDLPDDELARTVRTAVPARTGEAPETLRELEQRTRAAARQLQAERNR